MMTDDTLEALNSALDARTRDAGAVRLWLRDDDAIAPGNALDRLLKVTSRYAIPLTLAVIPAHTDTLLAERLASAEQVAVAVHGWAHQNHAPENEKKQELGAHRSVDVVLGELRKGFSTLRELHAGRFVPLLVPPWNRISPAVVAELSAVGFQALSTFGNESPSAISLLNTHVDIIDWKGNRGGRDAATLVHELIAQLRQNTDPVGVLTHHLVHDEPAWQFMENLFRATATRQDVTWLSGHELIESIRPG